MISSNNTNELPMFYEEELQRQFRRQMIAAALIDLDLAFCLDEDEKDS